MAESPDTGRDRNLHCAGPYTPDREKQQYRRPQKIEPDFWETQRQNQRR